MAQTSAVALVERPSPARVGAVVWLASELMFFAGLFAAYFTIRASVDSWPPAGVDLNTPRMAVFTAVLVASSVTMQLAHHAAERGDVRALRRLLGATVLLGAVFLTNQGLEYAANTFSVSSHAYGSIYYLMTGLHGLHVLGGLLAMVLLMIRASVDADVVAQEPAVAVVSYYWHFVDVVWIALFATLYFVR
jgi:cytochrome c oxidase subunit 3